MDFRVPRTVKPSFYEILTLTKNQVQNSAFR